MSSSSLRSPVIAIIGSVNTGKTTFIKCITNTTSIPSKEVNNITQTLIPYNVSKKRILDIATISSDKINIPSMIIIDTPGHAPFTYMRETAMNISDFTIVLIDINDGIQPLTSKAITHLISIKKPFLIAVNKIDTIPNWIQPTVNTRRIKDSLSVQSSDVIIQYEILIGKIIKQLLIDFGMQSEIYYKNKNVRSCISIVPFSANSNEGLADIIMFSDYCAEHMVNISHNNKLELFLLHEQRKQGNYFLNCLLLNGELNSGDVLYINNNVKCKILNIISNNKSTKTCTSSAIVSIMISRPDCVVETNRFITSSEISSSQNDDVQQNHQNIGITIWSHSTGHVNAMAEVLNDGSFSIDGKIMNIPIKNKVVGDIKRTDIIKCAMNNNKLFRVILYYSPNEHNREIPSSLLSFARDNNVCIFTSSHIYDLRDLYNAYVRDNYIIKQTVNINGCIIDVSGKIEIIPKYIFRKTNPIIIGVKIMKGCVSVSEMVITGNDGMDIGRITSIEKDKKSILKAIENDEVSIKIDSKRCVDMKDIKNNSILYCKLLVSSKC